MLYMHALCQHACSLLHMHNEILILTSNSINCANARDYVRRAMKICTAL